VHAGLFSEISFWFFLSGLKSNCAVTAAAPLLQAIIGFDKSAASGSQPSKVKLPLVSLFVMLGSAWLLIAVPQAGLALWLGFACIGGFILNTYWVEQ
jgi:hypothetical protein